MSHSIQWQADPSLRYFEGHFPQNPVLPAVAIIDVSLEQARLVSQNASLQITRIKNCKFTQPILPGTQILIRFSHVQDLWSFEWMSPDSTQTFAKLELHFHS
jgi:3-hydroxymyristoyl/3-hydroxydecanoyl-(acyl carrier protein) dehydratase